MARIKSRESDHRRDVRSYLVIFEFVSHRTTQIRDSSFLRHKNHEFDGSSDVVWDAIAYGVINSEA